MITTKAPGQIRNSDTFSPVYQAACFDPCYGNIDDQVTTYYLGIGNKPCSFIMPTPTFNLLRSDNTVAVTVIWRVGKGTNKMKPCICIGKWVPGYRVPLQ